MLNHDRIADRLLHQADQPDTDPAEVARLVARAAAHAALAQAEQAELRNMIAAYAIADQLEFDTAALILRRQIRRRLRLFPPLTSDGQNPNGDN
jgi:hypothetical protein